MFQYMRHLHRVFSAAFSRQSMFLLSFLLATSSFANPEGGVVSAGDASISHPTAGVV